MVVTSDRPIEWLSWQESTRAVDFDLSLTYNLNAPQEFFISCVLDCSIDSHSLCKHSEFPIPCLRIGALTESMVSSHNE